MTEEELTHISEVALDDYAPDIFIVNFNDNLKLLQESANKLAEDLIND